VNRRIPYQYVLRIREHMYLYITVGGYAGYPGRKRVLTFLIWSSSECCRIPMSLLSHSSWGVVCRTYKPESVSTWEATVWHCSPAGLAPAHYNLRTHVLLNLTSFGPGCCHVIGRWFGNGYPNGTKWPWKGGSNSHPNLKWWAMVHRKRLLELLEKYDCRTETETTSAWRGVQVSCRW